MIFNTQVNGIPCRCQVLYYEPPVPMRITGPGMGDADPPEGAVFDFQILDRKGYKAAWLEKYLTDEVADRLMEESELLAMAEYYTA